MLPFTQSALGAMHGARARERRPNTVIATCVAVLLLLLAALAACGPSTGAATSPTPSPTRAFTPIPPTPSTGQYPIRVYFSKFPEAAITGVFPVNRVSTTSAVETASIQFLIAGPTPDERSAGYFTELNSVLTGPSACSAPYPTGGPDFTLQLATRGTHQDPKATTLRFCRQTALPGEGTGARIKAEITATLMQFPGITTVVILTKDGHCFDDLKGGDSCLA